MKRILCHVKGINIAKTTLTFDNANSTLNIVHYTLEMLYRFNYMCVLIMELKYKAFGMFVVAMKAYLINEPSYIPYQSSIELEFLMRVFNYC